MLINDCKFLFVECVSVTEKGMWFSSIFVSLNSLLNYDLFDVQVNKCWFFYIYDFVCCRRYILITKQSENIAVKCAILLKWKSGKPMCIKLVYNRKKDVLIIMTLVVTTRTVRNIQWDAQKKSKRRHHGTKMTYVNLMSLCYCYYSNWCTLKPFWIWLLYIVCLE